MAIRDKSTWMAILFIFAGLVIGGLLGEVAAKVDWLNWLSYGQTFGIDNPFVLIKCSMQCCHCNITYVM